MVMPGLPGRNLVVRPAAIFVPSGTRATNNSLGWSIAMRGFDAGYDDGIPDPSNPASDVGAMSFPVDNGLHDVTYTNFFRPINPGDVDQFAITIDIDARNSTGLFPATKSPFTAKLRITFVTANTMAWDPYKTSFFGGPHLFPDPCPSVAKPTPSPLDPYVEKFLTVPAQTDVLMSITMVVDASSLGNVPLLGIVSEVYPVEPDVLPGQSQWGFGGSCSSWTTREPVSFPVVAREAYDLDTGEFPGVVNVRKLYLQKASEDDPTLNSVSTFWLPAYHNRSCDQPECFGEREFSNAQMLMRVYGVQPGTNVVTTTRGPKPLPDVNDYYDSWEWLGPSIGWPFAPLAYIYCGGWNLGFDVAENALIYARFDGTGYTEPKTDCSGVVTFEWTGY